MPTTPRVYLCASGAGGASRGRWSSDAAASTGATPIEWLIRLRVRRAQDLLETTDLPIDRVAHDAGFGAPETLRHHFRCVVGTTPSAWRNSFRGRLTAQNKTGAARAPVQISMA